MVHIRTITRDGRRYAIRDGYEFEIESVDTGVDGEAIKTARGQRRISFPWAYLEEVCRHTKGKWAAAVIALYIYRRMHVCKSRTVTLPSMELKALGIYRQLKLQALHQLATAGLIRIEKNLAGRASKVTLLWDH
jgi:hypothetical protein